MRTKTDLHIPGCAARMGDLARNVVSGFEGIVYGHQRHLTGCDTVWLMGEPGSGKDGEAARSTADVLAIELIESNPRGIESMPKDVPAAG